MLLFILLAYLYRPEVVFIISHQSVFRRGPSPLSSLPPSFSVARFKITLARVQNPATDREDLLKIQQEKERGLIQNPATH